MSNDKAPPQTVMDFGLVNINRKHWKNYDAQGNPNEEEDCPFVGSCRCDIDCEGCQVDADECICEEYKLADPDWIPFSERYEESHTPSKRQQLLSITSLWFASELGIDDDSIEWCNDWVDKKLKEMGCPLIPEPDDQDC